MIALDSNILVYAHRREPAVHAAARDLVTGLAQGTSPWAIPWPCLFEFFSVVTNPRIWKDSATKPAAASAQINAWLGSPSLRLLAETSQHFTVLSPLIENSRVRGPVVHDARIAALCLAHGVDELLTRDRDFGLFPGLPTRDPF